MCIVKNTVRIAYDQPYSTKAEELRKRVIQESKYLGGDMKHTHLVKGLDYALLQKVPLLF